ncbi:hypothetical protein ACS0TY_015120 [Phlomoides rotata]
MQAQEETLLIKGKRSKRPRPASPLSLTIATTSSTTAELSGSGVVSDVVSGSSYRLTPSPSNSGEFMADEEEEDMANCLILLAKGRSSPPPPPTAAEAYQCKTCNKSFLSFQALGGHRASHRKPNKLEDQKKPVMMREKQEGFDRTILSLQLSNRVAGSKSRVHQCTICGAEFGSGQALGGHMRRHRPIPTAAHGGVKKARNLLSLDLNLPAPEDDHSESKFPFSATEQVIVFSASPLIDCQY